jgi:hypothetical protein
MKNTINHNTHLALTDTQKEVSRWNALDHTARAFEAIARGEEGWARLHARAAYRYARQIVEGVKR